MCREWGGVSAMTQCRWGGRSTKRIQDYVCESLQLYTVLWNSFDDLSHNVIILFKLGFFLMNQI